MCQRHADVKKSICWKVLTLTLRTAGGLEGGLRTMWTSSASRNSATARGGCCGSDRPVLSAASSSDSSSAVQCARSLHAASNALSCWGGLSLRGCDGLMSDRRMEGAIGRRQLVRAQRNLT